MPIPLQRAFFGEHVYVESLLVSRESLFVYSQHRNGPFSFACFCKGAAEERTGC